MTDIEYLRLALVEAKKCAKSNDVPIGAVIVMDGKIIARAHNERNKRGLASAHAEVLAINKANKKMGDFRLTGATIYVTKEPCLMCMGTILSARISRICYGARDRRFGTESLATNNNFNHKCSIVGGILEHECESIISDFFKKVRNGK